MNDFLKGAKTIGQLHKKWIKDPKYKKAYEKLKPEYELINALIQKRAAKNLTQSQLAKKLGLSQPVIAKLESGRYNPSIKFLRKVVKSLDAELIVTIK